MATRERSNNNNNIKALFSVICLCIIALGLIVYFSTHSKSTTDVNEATTVVETRTTAVAKPITKREVTTTEKQTTQKATKKAKPTTTEQMTMESGDTNTPYKSFYKYPCSEEILSGYTEELVKNSTMGDYRAHTAIDFRCPSGSDVQAINDGLVLAVKKDPLLGTVIEIDHGGKLVARYCGLDNVNVSTNDYVTMGQNIATTGKLPFESDSEPHLHFETLLDGKYVNPLDVMTKSE